MSAPAAAPDGPRVVTMTEAERRRGSYEIPRLQLALEGLHQDGVVVLRGLVDPEHCDRLYEHMTADRDRILRERHADGKAYNQGVNSNILQAPPFTKPELLFEDLHFNPFVIQVLNLYLGHRPRWAFTTGNNALAGTAGLRQAVHKDPRFQHPKCPFLVVANTALSAFTRANGATEFWLGTHAFTDERHQTAARESEKQRPGQPGGSVRPELVEARRALRPPVYACLEKGDVCLRDYRTWHAGMPNETQSDRIMIAQAWMAPWYPNITTRELDLPKSQSEFFLGVARRFDIEVAANFVGDDEVEARQHHDNIYYAPDAYLDYYESAPLNYDYGLPI